MAQMHSPVDHETEAEIRRRAESAGVPVSRYRAYAEPLAVLPFDAASADVAARLRKETADGVRGLAGWDLLLAATAMQRALTIATTEPRLFARMPGLAVEDWSA